MIPPSSDVNVYDTPTPQLEPISWWEAWLKALTAPSEATFQRIGYGPGASFWRAAIWLFIASLISFLISALAGLALNSPQFTQLEQATGVDLGSVVGVLGLLVCLVPFGAAIGVGFAALWAALVQWIAKLLGGTGDFNALFNSFAAFSAPMSIVSALFGAIPIPAVSGCIGTIIAIYNLVLSVIAVQAINRFGYGKAIAAVLIPFAVLFSCCCLLAFLLVTVMGASLGGLEQLLITPAP